MKNAFNNFHFAEFVDEQSGPSAKSKFDTWRDSLQRNGGSISHVTSGVVGGINSEGFVDHLTYIHVWYFPPVPEKINGK